MNEAFPADEQSWFGSLSHATDVCLPPLGRVPCERGWLSIPTPLKALLLLLLLQPTREYNLSDSRSYDTSRPVDIYSGALQLVSPYHFIPSVAVCCVLLFPRKNMW